MSFGRLGALGQGFGRLGLLGGVNPRAQLIASLKAAGVYSLLDYFYLLAAPDAATAAVDLIAARSLTVSGSPTFVANKGYTGDGVSAYLDTNYNPSTQATNLSQNSSTFGIFSLTAVVDPAGGWDLGQSTLSIAPFGSVGTAFFSRNGSSSSDQIAFQQPSATPSLYTSRRNASTGFDIFYGGAQIFNSTAASTGANIWTSGNEQQGWTTDGSFYYTAQTGSTPAIIQRNLATWAAIQTNSNIFTGLSGSGLNHVGDISYANSKIYAPIGRWSGSCGGANGQNSIAVFRTSDLTLVQSSSAITTSASGSGISGLAADTDHNILYGVDYCDPTVIYRFDLTTLAQLSSITISISPFSGLQGIAYLNNTLYLSASDGTAFQIPILDLNGNLTGVLHDVGVSGYEGIGIVGSTVGIMGDNQSSTALVNFYNIPSIGTSQSITRTSGAIASANMTAFKINGGSAFTSNQLSALFAGGAMTNAQIASFNTALRTYLHRVGAF